MKQETTQPARASIGKSVSGLSRTEMITTNVEKVSERLSFAAALIEAESIFFAIRKLYTKSDAH